MADVFRRHRPKVVVHLGRVRRETLPNAERRYAQNVLGTKNILELCARWGVERAVVLSTYHVYGAHPTNHLLLREDEPLRAVQVFPEIVDAVELDHAATTFLWQHREVSTAVLRPVNVIGPDLRNLMSRLLRLRRCPKLLGYDPLMQFIHQQDLARAVVLAVGHPEKHGVFNIGGEGAVAWSRAIRISGSRMWLVPNMLAEPATAIVDTFKRAFPRHLLPYFRYPTMVDDKLFRAEFGFKPELTTVEALSSVKQHT